MTKAADLSFIMSKLDPVKCCTALLTVFQAGSSLGGGGGSCGLNETKKKPQFNSLSQNQNFKWYRVIKSFRTHCGKKRKCW